MPNDGVTFHLRLGGEDIRQLELLQFDKKNIPKDYFGNYQLQLHHNDTGELDS